MYENTKWMDMFNMSEEDQLGFIAWLNTSATDRQRAILDIQFHFFEKEEREKVLERLQYLDNLVKQRKLPRVIENCDKLTSIQEKHIKALDEVIENSRRRSADYMWDAYFYFGLAAFQIVFLVLYFVNK
jgi:hypothetical protein